MIISQTAVLIFLCVISIIALIILINDRSYGSRRQTGIHQSVPQSTVRLLKGSSDISPNAGIKLSQLLQGSPSPSPLGEAAQSVSNSLAIKQWTLHRTDGRHAGALVQREGGGGRGKQEGDLIPKATVCEGCIAKKDVQGNAMHTQYRLATQRRRYII